MFDKAIAEEKIGFLGYYGDSLDFLIYQDIIRMTVEEVLGIAVRKDFHFISVPIESSHPLYVLEDLSPLFKREVFPTLTVMENTFPLNFSLLSSHNQLGLNSVVNFSKNTGESSWRNRRELQQFFLRLGMNPTQIETFYDLGHQLLDTSSGVLLQFFDASPSPYAFANAVGYASYPNGFIAENRLISEYFVDNPTPSFPQELRLILTLRGTFFASLFTTCSQTLHQNPGEQAQDVGATITDIDPKKPLLTRLKGMS